MMVLFFTHIPFVVNHTINATPPERLQQYNAKDRLLTEGGWPNQGQTIRTRERFLKLNAERCDEVNDIASSRDVEIGQTKLKYQRKSVQELFHTLEQYALNINFRVKFVLTFILTGIPRVKTGLFDKSTSASFVQRWFVYYVTVLRITPR